MSLVKAYGDGVKTVYFLPRIMQANHKLGLDLDTHAPFSVPITTVGRPHELSYS